MWQHPCSRASLTTIVTLTMPGVRVNRVLPTRTGFGLHGTIVVVSFTHGFQTALPVPLRVERGAAIGRPPSSGRRTHAQLGGTQ